MHRWSRARWRWRIFEKSEQMIVELSKRYHVHPNHIKELKRWLLDHIADVFQQGKES